jgi:Sec-independent protein secretion pathway component TatC
LYLSFGVLVGACLLYFVIGDYYERRFGWVQTFSMERKQVVAAIIGMTVLLVIGSVNLLFQPPIHMIWLVWGVALTAIYWRERRFRVHYVAVGVLVSALSFLPLLSISQTVLSHEAGGLLLFLGVLFVVGGTLDHLLLVRIMKALPKEDDGRAV